MPMTSADWESWTPDKREFYAMLFTCYSISDGVLRIDAQRRQQHVQRQLLKKKKDGEQIINSSVLANYILTDGLKDDKLKIEEGISILCLQRPFKSMEGSSAASSDPTTHKHTLVGGFWSETQSREAHFEKVVKEKMCGGSDVAKTTIKESAHFIPLSNMDDFTILSSCALLPEEKSFLLDDPFFKRAIEAEARRLLESEQFELSTEDLITKIRSHLDECSKQESLAVSLQNLSVPRVSTHWVLFSQKQFNQICKFVTGIEKDKFIPPIDMPLSNALMEGPSKFAFLSEYTNLLKIALWQHVFDGKSIDDIDALITNPIREVELNFEKLVKMFSAIAKQQIKFITEGELPVSPWFMGRKWELYRSPEEILNILKNIHYIDLCNRLEMSGFLRENIHLALGFQSSHLVKKINESLRGIWDTNSNALLDGVRLFIHKNHAPAPLELAPKTSYPVKASGAYTLFGDKFDAPDKARLVHRNPGKQERSESSGSEPDFTVPNTKPK